MKNNYRFTHRARLQSNIVWRPTLWLLAPAFYFDGVQLSVDFSRINIWIEGRRPMNESMDN